MLVIHQLLNSLAVNKTLLEKQRNYTFTGINAVVIALNHERMLTCFGGLY